MKENKKVFNVIQYAFNDQEKSGYCRPRELEDGEDLREPEIDENDFPIYYDVSKKFAALLVGSHPDRYRLYECGTVTIRVKSGSKNRYEKAKVYTYEMKQKLTGHGSQNEAEYEEKPVFSIYTPKNSFFKSGPVTEEKDAESENIKPILPSNPNPAIGKGAEGPGFVPGHTMLKNIREKAVKAGIDEAIVKGIEIKYREVIGKKTGAFSKAEYPVILNLFAEAITDHVTS